jgi:nicotinamide mononucleotide transporter
MIDIIKNFFDINNIFFTVIGYPMSYLEFFGTLFNLWCVWLCAKNKILNWPVGIIGVILFFALFYQIRLYSDMFEQVYFFATSVYGWWVWSKMERPGADGKKPERKITANSPGTNLIYAGAIGVLTLVLGFAMSRIHLWLPDLFPEAASFPYLDAFTTVMSFAANLLLAQRKLENWPLWILVDIIGVWLYWVKDVKLISILYLIFLILATRGLINWVKERRTYKTI